MRDSEIKPYWLPGGWTPVRCELWRNMKTDEEKERLVLWIYREGERNKVHKTQLPEGYNKKGKYNGK